MKPPPDLFSMLVTLFLPILLGYLLRRRQWFSERDVQVLRRFVMRIGVPFLIFQNLHHADMQSMGQAIPIILAFSLLTIANTALARFAADRIQGDPPRAHALAFGIIAGNYAFMGWGVVAAFFGPAALTRAMFFSMFFWPVFLLSGFWLVHRRRQYCSSPEPVHSLWRLLLTNAGLPFGFALAGLALNLGGVRLPVVLDQFFSSFGNITIPLMLCTIGMHLRLRPPRATWRVIGHAVGLRLVVGFMIGILVVEAIGLVFNLDAFSRRMLLIQSTMPSATMSTFFSEHICMDEESLSGVIAFTTLASFVTLPLWYMVIVRLVP